MNDTPALSPDQDADSIPAGQRLVRAEGQGVSLGDRLAARFYRLIWQTPLHGLKLKGRHPLKLAGVPLDPVAGDADVGAALLQGRFSHAGEAFDVEKGIIAGLSASVAFQAWLCSFSWLRDLGTQDRVAAAMQAERCVHSWLTAHGESVAEPAWRPDVSARRILFWAAHAPLILSSTDLVYRSAVLNHVARTGRHLDRTANRVPPGARRVMAWCGVIAAGLLIPGNEPRRLFGESEAVKALANSLTSEGGSRCRAPDAQAELLDTLLLLRATYAMRKLDMPVALEEALGRVAAVLAGTMLGDGGLSSWQGGVPAQSVQPLLEATAPIVRPARQSREWGYQRMAAGNTIILLDTAPPPLSHVSHQGCASTLAFEFSDGAERIVVNCGGARAGGIAAMPALAEGLRTTAAHSTLTLADSNSTAIHKGGQIGKGVSETTLDRTETDGGSRIEAGHDGYLRRFGFFHQRSLVLTADGSEIRGEDTLIPGARKVKGGTPFVVRFHLAPGVDPSPTASELGALLQTGHDQAWQFRARGGQLLIEESLWIGPDGLIQPSQQLVISSRADPGGATIGWAFKRIG